jgi:hypothetical protein
MEDLTANASESQLGQLLGGWAEAFDGLQVLIVTYAFLGDRSDPDPDCRLERVTPAGAVGQEPAQAHAQG